MSTDYDLVIIGAGIHGVAVADEAVRRGQRVLVLEQFDRPAQGTSSKSSKLIHGGLRYLETFELKLVYECLSERRRLIRKYPDLVRLQKFHIPVYRSTTRSSLIIRIGLSLYAALAGFRSDNLFRKLKREEWAGLDGLETRGLLAVYQYFDAQTDDAALTTRILQEAATGGAEVQMNAELTRCQRQDSQLDIEYQCEGSTHQVTTRWLINAAGPWVNQVAALCQPQPKTLEVDLVQGAHIELPGELKQGGYYMEAPQDQRAVFALPWKGHLLVGTTETVFEGDPANSAATEEEVDYLLAVYNHHFPEARKTRDDLITTWAGLRVLPRSDGSPFSRSRETILLPDEANDPRIYSIYGGKLTSHHAVAVRLMDMLESRL